MKRRIISAVMAAVAVIMCCACSSQPTTIRFAYASSEPLDYARAKIFHTSEAMDELVFNMDLSVDVGTVNIRIMDANANELVWKVDYTESGNYQIELFDLPADNEYKIQVVATGIENLMLLLTTDAKLTEDKDVLNHYHVENR